MIGNVKVTSSGYDPDGPRPTGPLSDDRATVVPADTQEALPTITELHVGLFAAMSDEVETYGPSAAEIYAVLRSLAPSGTHVLVSKEELERALLSAVIIRGKPDVGVTLAHDLSRKIAGWLKP